MSRLFLNYFVLLSCRLTKYTFNFFRNFINTSRAQYMTSVYDKNLSMYRVFYAEKGVGYENKNLDFHFLTRSFWSGGVPGSSATVRNVSGEERPYVGDSAGFVYRTNFGITYDNSGIIWNFRIPFRSHGSPSVLKKARSIFATMKKESNFDVQCDVYLDGSDDLDQTLTLSTASISGSALWDSAVWDTDSWPTSPTFQGHAYVEREYKTMSLDLKGSGVNQPVVVESVEVYAKGLHVDVKP